MGTHSLSSLLRAPEGLFVLWGCPQTSARTLAPPKNQSWRLSGRHVALSESARPGCATLGKSPNLSVPSPSVGVIPGIERLAEVTLHIGRNWEACIAGEPGTRGGERGTWGHKAELVQSHTALSTLAVGDSGEGTVLKIFSVPGWKSKVSCGLGCGGEE